MELNKYIEHTNLRSDATIQDIQKLCEEALKYKMEAVCVAPCYVSLAKELLEKSNVGIATVVGFPFGMNTIEVKEYEAIDAINKGADEIDMIMNIGCFKNKDFDYIKKEIETVRDSIDGHPLKVGIETCYLEKEEIIKFIDICNEMFVNSIKITTCFGSAGAKVEDIELSKEHKSDILQIEVSGEIATEEEAIAMIEAGATRIGTSHGVEILTGKKKEVCCHGSKECGHDCTCEHEDVENEGI